MACSLTIHVVPQAGRQSCAYDKSGRIKVYLLSAPERGKANRELIAFFAHKLGLPQRQIEIVAGETARKKRLLIDAPFTLAQVLEACGLEKQQTLFEEK